MQYDGIVGFIKCVNLTTYVIVAAQIRCIGAKLQWASEMAPGVTQLHKKAMKRI